MFYGRTLLLILCLFSATLAQFYSTGGYSEIDFPDSYFTDDIDPFERDFNDDLDSFEEDEDDKSGWMIVSEGEAADLVNGIEAAEEQDKRTAHASLTTATQEIESNPTEKLSGEEEDKVEETTTTPLRTVVSMISSLWTSIPAMGMETDKSLKITEAETSKADKITAAIETETPGTIEELKEPTQEIQKAEEEMKVLETESPTIETRTETSTIDKVALELETGAPKTDEGTQEASTEIQKPEEENSEIKAETPEAVEGEKEVEAPRSGEAGSEMKTKTPEAAKEGEESVREKPIESVIKPTDALKESEAQITNLEAEATDTPQGEDTLTAPVDESIITSTESQ